MLSVRFFTGLLHWTRRLRLSNMRPAVRFFFGSQVLHVGPTRESKARAEARAKKYTPKNLDRVELWINKRNNLVFQGKLHPRPVGD